MNATQAPELVAVLDMGASAIRLVVAEIAAGARPRIVEEATRGVRLGRDTFSSRSIKSRTVDAAIAALDGFRRIIDGYRVEHIRAVATSAVREARNADMVLDRIRGRTGITFEHMRADREGTEQRWPHPSQQAPSSRPSRRRA